MAYCIQCKKNVGCGCNLLESKFCSQACKDEYLNKQDANISTEKVSELRQSEVLIEGDRYEAV